MNELLNKILLKQMVKILQSIKFKIYNQPRDIFQGLLNRFNHKIYLENILKKIKNNEKINVVFLYIIRPCGSKKLSIVK